jgi:hypothetical protein
MILANAGAATKVCASILARKKRPMQGTINTGHPDNVSTNMQPVVANRNCSPTAADYTP